MDTGEESSSTKLSSNKSKHYHFGHGTQKTFKSKPKPKKDAIESMVVDLEESLKDL